jgi:hypothetical protein
MRNVLVRSVLVAAVLAFRVPASEGEEVYVVRFFTPRYITSTTECLMVGWWDHLIFRNTANEDQTVRLIEASNGYQPSREESLVLPRNRTRSLYSYRNTPQPGGSNVWTPDEPYVFLVNRLDVPAGVLLESRGEVYGGAGEGTPLPCEPFRVGVSVLGSFSLPTVRSLVPSNSRQFHLGSDLGTLVSRTNVGIYNGGPAAATATIEVRRGCDDALVESRNVSVPANTVIQAGGFINDYQRSGCLGFGSSPDHNRYVVVTVDQPSFSFVTTIAQDLPPKIAVSAKRAR